MKVAFFHSDPMVSTPDGEVYSGTFSYSIWQRYLNVFDSLVVTTRMRAGKKENLKQNMELSSGPRVTFCPVTQFAKRTDLIFKKKAISEQVRSVLRQCDCAIIRLPSLVSFVACKEAVKMGKPFLVEVVGCAWDAYWRHSISGKVIAPIVYFKTKAAVRDATHVVYVTDEFLQRRYPTRGKSIGCSDVFLNVIEDTVLSSRLEKIKNRAPDDTIILGTVAAVNVRYKGQAYVMQALAKLKSKGVTRFKYQLVGGGDPVYLKSVAQKLDVADQVEFTGKLPHDEVFKWLDNIDIYIQPSLAEGMPRALIEAMSRGLPSIGSDAGGIPELLEEEYLVPNINKNIDRLCELLKSFDSETMALQATTNFNNAGKYHKKILDEKRESFLREFKGFAEKQTEKKEQ